MIWTSHLLLYFRQIFPFKFLLFPFPWKFLGRFGFRIWFRMGSDSELGNGFDTNTRSRSQVWLILSQEECQQIIRQSDNIRSRLMRRLLSAPGRSCLLGKLWRFTQNLWQDKSNIFHFSERSRSWFLEGEGRGRRGDRPGAQNLNLIRNTLKYIVINPGRFNLPTNIPCNLVHFIFPSPVTLFVCLFVPSSCLPPRLCRISPDHLHLPDLSTQTLKWLQGPAGEEEEWPSLSRRLPGHGSLGGPHEGVSCVSWCHGVMALLSAHVECRSNSWTASCQCPQSGPTPGQSPSDSRLRLRPRVHGSYTLSAVTPVFIAATSHSPGQSQVHIITVVTRGNEESNCDNKIRPR